MKKKFDQLVLMLDSVVDEATMACTISIGDAKDAETEHCEQLKAAKTAKTAKNLNSCSD